MRRTAFLSAALLIVASCGDSPTRPTQVTGSAGTQVTGPANPPIASEIGVGEITPGSGATLVLHECGGGLCTNQLQTTFDVLVPTDMANAVVIVSLHQGSMPCASAYIHTTLNGGNRTPFSTSSIAMNYDEDGTLLCALPTETTRLVFQVFHKNAPAQAVLARELPYRYRLATQ